MKVTLTLMPTNQETAILPVVLVMVVTHKFRLLFYDFANMFLWVLVDSDSCVSSDHSEVKSAVQSNKQQNLVFEKVIKPAQPPPKTTDGEVPTKKTRELYGANENCYVMDAKSTGNIGRYLNVKQNQ